MKIYAGNEGSIGAGLCVEPGTVLEKGVGKGKVEVGLIVGDGEGEGEGEGDAGGDDGFGEECVWGVGVGFVSFGWFWGIGWCR